MLKLNCKLVRQPSYYLSTSMLSTQGHTQYDGGNKLLHTILKAPWKYAHNLQLQEELQNQHFYKMLCQKCFKKWSLQECWCISAAGDKQIRHMQAEKKLSVLATSFISSYQPGTHFQEGDSSDDSTKFHSLPSLTRFTKLEWASSCF